MTPNWPAYHQVLGEICYPKDACESISSRLQNHCLKCACDGSVRNGKATFGYIIQGDTTDTSLTGMGVFPPQYGPLSSLRAETYGALCLISCLDKITDNIKGRGINYVVYIDNAEV